MNISISTTQWGDARQVASRDSSNRRSGVISRNLIMALSTVTLAGLMVIQAIGPAAIDTRPIDDGSVEHSAELLSGEDFLALEELSVDELLQFELGNTAISSGSSALPK
ncbi:MAG: hypothetical protein AMJ88_02895 [Anaerolineae bacterium SM23_ 63]|nr:MAG: hypothetical protein AMJ88_02895 [Anaerolineae bacterium SM23_ 63]HEY46969.1 hypothetical protein [Anaerolineae bacterium]